MSAGIGVLGVLGTLVATCALLGGCRQVPHAEYEVAAADRVTGSVELAEDESGLMLGPLDAESRRGLLALSAWSESARTRVHARFDDGGTASVLRSSTPGMRGDRRVNLVEIRADGADTPDLRTTIALADEGLVSLDTLSGGVLSEFEPSALFLPSELSSGESVERAFSVRSSGGPIGGGSDGEGTVRIEGIGRQAIGTPLGMFDAFVVDSELSMKVGVARIVFSKRMWIDDAFGLVAERKRDRVTVFGVAVRKRDSVSVVVSESAEVER